VIEGDNSCRAFQDFVVKRRKWFRRSPEGEGVPCLLSFSAPISMQRTVDLPAPAPLFGRNAIKRAAGIAHCGSPGSKMDCLQKPTPAPVRKVKNTPDRA
jgi:hypothetical protein